MTRKFLSLILAVSMAVCLCMVSALAAVPTYAAQSAQRSIDRWASYGVIDASDPTLEAESELTYARLAEILVKLLKLPSAGASFGTDSSITDAIRRCAAAGLLDTSESGSVNADAAISSDKAMLMLGRALGLEPVKNAKLKNSSGMDSETKGMIAALVQAGVVSESQVSTTSSASLGSVASILDRAIGTYANEDGAKVNVSESKGITLIVANNVTVSGSADTIVVASSNGSVKLDGVSAEKVAVTGKSAKVELNNAEAKSVVASGTKAAIETKGETKVEALAVTGSEAAVKTADNTTVGSFTVNANNATVTTEGNTKVETLSVEGSKVEVKTAGETSVGSLTVNAKNSSITTEGNTKVEALAVGGSEVEVKTAGETSVGSLTVSASNSTVTTEGNTKVQALAVEGSDVAVKTTGETSVGSLTVSADNASVTTEGNTKVEALAVAGANASVEAKGSAKIAAVAVDEKATGTTVSAGSGTTISAIENKAENTTVTGSGKVESVTSSKDVTVETSGTQISNSGKGEIAVTDSSGQASSVTTGESASVHVHSYRASTVSPTCTEAGVTSYTCSCGNSYSEAIAALAHQFGAYAYADATQHTHTCTVCNAVVSHEHSTPQDSNVCSDCGVYFVKTADLLQAAIAAERAENTGKTIVLTDNVTGMQTGLSIAQNIFLDLNRYTLGTAAGIRVMNITEGNVSIKNGTVSVAPIVNGRSSSSCDTISVNTASKKSVLLDLENVTVIGCENQKSGVTSETLETLVKGGMYNYQTTAGTALYIYGAGRDTTVNITDSTITGGYGSATNGTQAEYISIKGIGSGSNQAVGGIGISAYGDKTVVNITDSTVTGGNSDVYNAGHAVEGMCGNLNISGSTVTGGSSFSTASSYGYGGDAMYINGMFNQVNVTVTDSTVTGGDGGFSHIGSGIEAQRNTQITITDSTIRSGGGKNATKEDSDTAICTSAGWGEKTSVTFKGDNTLASSSTNKSVIYDMYSSGTIELELDGNLTIEKGRMFGNEFSEVGENASITVKEGAYIDSTSTTADGKTLTKGNDGVYRFTAAE